MQYSQTRNHGLDQLRGVCACSIMMLHLLYNYGIDFDANTYLGKIGYYGVCIFYVLSGLTLYKVYHNRIGQNVQQVGEFFTKRFFRIYPLLWLVVFYYVIRSLVLSNELIDPVKILLNLSGMFGFIAWDQYIGTGVWSIGNELVFYAVFPLLMFPYKRKVLLALLYSLTCLLFLSFTFNILPAHTSNLWHYYTNPLNHVWYFASGVLLGKLLKNLHPRSWMVYIIGIAGVLLFLWPTSGEASMNVLGMNRVIFSAGGLLITVFFYFEGIHITAFVQKQLSYIGEISYGIYLIHPIAIGIVSLIVKPYPNYWIPISISIVLTIVLSHLSYTYYEKRFMNHAKSLTRKKTETI